MHKKIVAAILICMFTGLAVAQEYKGAIGLRFGYGWGLSGKYFFNSNGYGRSSGHAIEGLLRYGYHGVVFTKPGVNISALYEKHWMLGRDERWSFLLGGGLSIGYGNKSTTNIFAFGIDPILGVDVLLRKFPVNFTFDYKPTIYFDKYLKNPTIKTKPSVSYYEIALSVRYAFTGGYSRRRR